MSDIQSILDKMWADYIQLNPQAQKIVDLLQAKGDQVVNDHIALRTFNHTKVTIDKIAKPFLELGYQEAGEYHFEEKKLYAKHFEHSDENIPKIFISELKLEEFSNSFKQKIDNIIAQIDAKAVSEPNFTFSGKTWDIDSQTYEELKKESDYGAWLSAIGYRPNHFTVYINKLNSFHEVAELNTFLKENGFSLNDSGGEIKGSKEVFLEQSSTLADSIEVEFSDKNMVIPSCYFEFAKRYELPTGKMYQGFVAKSADKIFESTDRVQ
jgi:hypothetical protein